jgi:hypothetical protein
MKSSLLAPCGINCGVCIAYLRPKNKCQGCRTEFNDKCKTRVQCKIKLCDKRSKKSKRFCFECDTFPCNRLYHMDKRYRTRYHISVIENLENMKKDGIRMFIKNEKIRWRCPSCGHVLCVHKEVCLVCGTKK